MGTNKIIAFGLASMLFVLPAAVFAQDELFDTKTAGTHVEKGLALLKEKKYDDAIAEFEEAADIYPAAESYYYLGYTFYLKGKKNDAASMKKSRENFDKAYELDPNFAPGKTRPVETIPPGTEIKSVESASTPAPAAPLVSAPTLSGPQQPAKPQEPSAPEPVKPAPAAAPQQPDATPPAAQTAPPTEEPAEPEAPPTAQ